VGKLLREQNPRCPPGGHLGFRAVLVFETNLPHVKSNPQNKIQINLPIGSCIQDVHLVAILDFGVLVFERNLL
jgi:hypothetical protein